MMVMMMKMIFQEPAGRGYLACCPRCFLGLRLSPLMVYLQQAIPYLPPLVAFYDMQENTAVQFNSPQNHKGRYRRHKRLVPVYSGCDAACLDVSLTLCMADIAESCSNPDECWQCCIRWCSQHHKWVNAEGGAAPICESNMNNNAVDIVLKW